MATRPLIKESLLMLNLSGLDPHRSRTLDSLKAVLSVTLLLVVGTEVLLDCIFNWEGLNSMDRVAIFVAFVQAIIKINTAVIYRKNLITVMEKTGKFWSTNKYGTKTQNEIESIYSLVRKAMTSMLGFVMFGCIVYSATSIFTNPRGLIFQSYHPVDINRHPDYEIVFALQVSSFFVGVPGLMGFDGLFVSLIVDIICELKLIKAGFKDMLINPDIKGDTKECLTELFEIIRHHNLTLDCIQDMRKIYSFLLLTVYFTNMVCMCSGLLAIIATGFPPTLENLIRYGIYFVFFTLQLLFYCMVGTYLITESESVAIVAYDTAWWAKTQPELRKAIALVIQRANKAEKLTAGGMFALNLASFRKVARTALSFFTLVEAVYKDN